MREALFILAVIAVLLGLTAFRYRKTIAGMIGLARALKQAKDQMKMPTRPLEPAPSRSGVLVNCAKCGTWIPKEKSLKRADLHYCSDECLR